METHTFHFSEEERESALLHIYMELQLPVASAKLAAQGPRGVEFLHEVVAVANVNISRTIK